jgi:hypothetical protein
VTALRQKTTTMRFDVLTRNALALFAALACTHVACDPVRNDQIAALGDEVPGVEQGPEHRAGQPCLLCHDGKLTNAKEFSVGGTVFRRAVDREPVAGVLVHLLGADGSTHEATTNGVGNFYVRPTEWVPVYPMRVSLEAEGMVVPMRTHVGRDGSCAGCHFDPPGPGSFGHVSLVNPFPDAG